MASSSSSSEHLDPWTSRPVAFSEDWFSEAYARDNETLTSPQVDSFSPFLDLIASNPRKVSIAGSSGPETLPARCSHRAGGPTGKVSKRKSRAAKRSQTTFINADPANFRQMVQQVTGVRFPAGGHQVSAGHLVEPEPQRLVRGLVPLGCLPTFDTSAFFMDRYQHDMNGVGPVEVRPEPLLVPEPVGADGPGRGFDFEAFSCFPTLDSWKVVS